MRHCITNVLPYPRMVSGPCPIHWFSLGHNYYAACGKLKRIVSDVAKSKSRVYVWGVPLKHTGDFPAGMGLILNVREIFLSESANRWYIHLYKRLNPLKDDSVSVPELSHGFRSINVTFFRRGCRRCPFSFPYPFVVRPISVMEHYIPTLLLFGDDNSTPLQRILGTKRCFDALKMVMGRRMTDAYWLQLDILSRRQFCTENYTGQNI